MTTTPHADAVLARVVDLRAELQSLAKELPAVARVLPAVELMATVEVLQESSNLLGACDAAVVAEVDRQGVHETFGATSTAALSAWRLRVRPAEAKRRVAVARACAERVGFSGEVMPPLREHVAAGQLSGDLSSDHAVVIARVLGRLPVHVPVDELSAVEAALVEYARSVDPQTDRDSCADDADIANADGVLDADADTDANGRDTRPADVRLCDALEEVDDRILRSRTLPDTGGVPATVAVTIPLAELEARTGQVHTATAAP